MGPGIHINARDSLERSPGSRITLDHVGRIEPGSGGAGDKLLTKLAKAQVATSVANEARGQDIPERSGTAVSQDYFVAVGEAKQLRQALLNTADQVFDGCLAVRGAKNALVLYEVIDLFSADL